MSRLATFAVALFARGRELAGQDTVEVIVPVDQEGTARLSDLRTALASQFPALATLAAGPRLAVNHAFANDDTRVRPADELALIPPVSGG